MNSTMAAFGHPEAGLERHREPVHDVSGSTLPRNKKIRQQGRNSTLRFSPITRARRMFGKMPAQSRLAHKFARGLMEKHIAAACAADLPPGRVGVLSVFADKSPSGCVEAMTETTPPMTSSRLVL